MLPGLLTSRLRGTTQIITGYVLNKKVLVGLSPQEQSKVIFMAFTEVFHSSHQNGYAASWAMLCAGLLQVQKSDRMTLSEALRTTKLLMELKDDGTSVLL
jgi:hypothetical protein